MDTTHINYNRNDIYSLLKKPESWSSGSSKNSNIHSSVFITDFSSASNDVFHIGKNGYKFKDMVLPKEIAEEAQNIIFEQQDREFLMNFDLQPTNKIMFYWEPGCWKTMITYAIAWMLRRELKIVNLSKLVSSHLWETSNNLANIFSKYWTKDYVLFIDEFDIIGRLRGDTNNEHNEMKRIVNTLLQLIDFFPSEGFLVFATNSMEIIDKALIRRLDRVIEIPLPDQASIKQFLKLKLSKYDKFLEKVNYITLSKSFQGKSFSDIQRTLQKTIKNMLIKHRKSGEIIKITTKDLEFQK